MLSEIKKSQRKTIKEFDYTKIRNFCMSKKKKKTTKMERQPTNAEGLFVANMTGKVLINNNIFVNLKHS